MSMVSEALEFITYVYDAHALDNSELSWLDWLGLRTAPQGLVPLTNPGQPQVAVQASGRVAAFFTR